MPQDKIMEVKQSCYLVATITVAGSQLLKYIHITKLEIIVLIGVISEAYKKPVLVKIIIDDLFPKVDMNFIIDNK